MVRIMETIADKKGYRAYREAQVQDLDQAKLIIMMFSGAVRFLDKAIALDPVNRMESGKYLSKAKLVLLELMASLDIENSGEMGPILLHTYRALFHKLNEAHLQDNIGKAIEVRASLFELENAWRQVFASPEYQRFKRDPEGYRAALLGR